MKKDLVIIPPGAKKAGNVIIEMKRSLGDFNYILVDYNIDDFSDENKVRRGIKVLRKKILGEIFKNPPRRIILYASGSCWYIAVIATVLSNAGIDYEIWTFERKVDKPVKTVEAKDI